MIIRKQHLNVPADLSSAEMSVAAIAKKIIKYLALDILWGLSFPRWTELDGGIALRRKKAAFIWCFLCKHQSMKLRRAAIKCGLSAWQ